MYDIKMLCQRSNISQQTFYRLMKENEEFRELVETNRQKRGNSYHYPETVLEWLTAYYLVSAKSATEKKDTSSKASERPFKPFEAVDREKPLLDRISALEGQIEALEAKLDEKEQERKALFVQNNQLLYLLAQEKQEKQALLPAPKKSFFERIKDVFSKKDSSAE